MNIKDYIKENILYLDGGMGTLLQKQGLLPGELPERWNLTHPEVITKIHLDYFNSGCNVVNTNTFGANCLKFSDAELENIIKAAIENAKSAVQKSKIDSPKWIALDVGPTGKMLSPYGDLDFEDAVSIFAKTVRIGTKYGADLIFIETMNDSYETKAAIIAAKENSDLPIFVSNAYGEDGKLMTGASPSAMVAMLEGLGADAIGVNCSLGPRALGSVVKEYLKYSSLPIILKPNAGLPKSVDGQTVYDISPDEFAEEVCGLIKEGCRIVGGCCGTTPEYIERTVKMSAGLVPSSIKEKSYTLVSSYTSSVEFDKKPIIIGERINPTGKKRVKEALINQDLDFILNEAIKQEECGAEILDVNVGLPGIDEKALLTKTVCELQRITALPLQIDTSDPSAMESALRRYNGKPMINSVNGKKESMSRIFPLAKKYGGVVVALTLDENGIPQKAEERLKIAEKILWEATKYGINKKDIIFDPLAMAVSADNTAAKETLRSLELISSTLNAKTSLGVSNVSFGLPCRDLINSSYFTMALTKGLSAAIMNPFSSEMMKAYHSYLALSGLDCNCAEYISFAEKLNSETVILPEQNKKAADKAEYHSDLQRSIIKGLKEESARLTESLLATIDGLQIVNGEIIPALNTVGEGYEEKKIYLPQLLMSAEAAKAAFEKIAEKSTTEATDNGATVIIATVKGDIHDIGKNIVKMILENYGYRVIDLGRDVEPQIILDEAKKRNAEFVGLSALMTTTVPAMEQTIKLLKKSLPKCKIIVGGAVLNEDYANKIGADKYANDAMDAVRYLKQIKGGTY